MLHITLLLLLCLSELYVLYCWKQWDYGVQWWVKGGTQEETAAEVANKKIVYYGVWSNETLEGATKEAPRSRRGHSMVIARTPDISPFFGHTYILMFGGRDNENITQHVPKTYNIVKINGTIEFSTYEDKPVNPCSDTEGLYYTPDQRAHCEGKLFIYYII